MPLSTRLSAALRAAAIHLAASTFVALAVAALVLGLWFPAPLHILTGGQALFLILIVVDVVCGPLLTLVLYNHARSKWMLNLSMIVFLQLAALAHGLSQVATHVQFSWRLRATAFESSNESHDRNIK